MANRSRIEMSQQIFHSQRLISQAEDASVTIPDADKPRWIRKLSDDDASLMAKADVSNQQKITRQIRAIQIEHDETRYFAVLGLGEIDTTPSGLQPIELTPGLFSAKFVMTTTQGNQCLRNSLDAALGFHRLYLFDFHHANTGSDVQKTPLAKHLATYSGVGPPGS